MVSNEEGPKIEEPPPANDIEDSIVRYEREIDEITRNSLCSFMRNEQKVNTRSIQVPT